MLAQRYEFSHLICNTRHSDNRLAILLCWDLQTLPHQKRTVNVIEALNVDNNLLERAGSIHGLSKAPH